MIRAFAAATLALGFMLLVPACGSVISVPDQGVITLGCQSPSLCITNGCDCKRASLDKGHLMGCDQTPPSCAAPPCECPSATTCSEPAKACIARGMGTACAGRGARCQPYTKTCADPGGDPPQLVTINVDGGMGPVLTPRCAFADDICCPGTPTDGGI